MMKVCKKCKEEKPVTEFYKHVTNLDGLYGVCKECHNTKCFGYHKKNRNQYLKKKRIYNKKYGTEMKRKHRENNPEKVKARNMVTRAIQKGILKRQPCEECGEIKSEAHHDDYSKQLEVRWLCEKHHKK